MSIQINIQGTLIDFPSSGQSPNWAPAIIEFAQAVEQALSGVVGPYDVPPQVIDIQNGVSGVDVLALSFASSVVRSFQIRYSIYRESSVPSELEAEAGIILAVYDGSTWSLERDYMGNKPSPSVTFSISGTGQVSYTSTSLTSLGYSGKFSFAAQALLQT